MMVINQFFPKAVRWESFLPEIAALTRFLLHEIARTVYCDIRRLSEKV